MAEGQPCRLLIVDDDRTILRLCSVILARQGFDVITAETGREGLRLAAETPIDAMVLDINLPDLPGLEVMRQVLKTRSMIVFLMTGDIQYNQEAAIKEGAVAVIHKPIQIAEVALRIRQVLADRSK